VGHKCNFLNCVVYLIDAADALEMSVQVLHDISQKLLLLFLSSR